MAKHSKSTWWDTLISKLREPRVRGIVLVLLFIGLFMISYNYFYYRQQQGFRIVERTELTEPEGSQAARENEEIDAERVDREKVTDTAGTDRASSLTTSTPDAADETTEQPAQEVVAETDPASVLAIMTWPVEGDVIRGLGWYYSEVLGEWRYHPGVNIKSVEKADVLAAVGGTVGQVEYVDGYGTTVTLEHPAGVKTVYGGLGEVLVKQDDPVAAAQPIGRIGAPPLGEAGVFQLHFEVVVDGTPMDPAEIMGK